MKMSNESRSRGVAIAILFLMAVMVIAGTGCQKPPEAELAAAKKTLGEAKAADAEKYAAALLSKSNESLTAAEKEIAAQDAKMPPLRKYAEARALISRASEEAKAALTEAGKCVSVTGLFVQTDGKPVAGMDIDFVEVERTGKKIGFSLVIGKDGTIQNPSVETDADGRFLFKLHPSVHSEFLATNKEYSLLLNVHGMAQLLNVQSMPYILRFKGEEGQLARQGQIDIGRFVIEGY